jgi:Pentapeptide repeats (8 copies)
VYTARNFSLSREGQVTDRYTKAIEQLGSDKLDVRIGGIFALERIARDSAKDHPTVMEVLAAFICEHSREQWPLPKSDDSAVSERTTRPDVQAALTVIGRRTIKHDRQSVDLRRACLPNADLAHADLTHVNLSRADLTRANLEYATLSHANLFSANLAGAYLNFANLTHPNLGSANLTGASLVSANLTDAFLRNADLTDATLSFADLAGVNLTLANLTRTDFGYAKNWRLGRPPEGWVRDPASGDLKRVDESTGDGGN